MKRLSSYTNLWTAMAVGQIMDKGACSYKYLRHSTKTVELGKTVKDYYLRQGYEGDEIVTRLIAEQDYLLNTGLVFEVELALQRRVFKVSALAFDKAVIEGCRNTGNWGRVLPEFYGAGGICISTFLNGAVVEARLDRRQRTVEGMLREIESARNDEVHLSTQLRQARADKKNKAPVQTQPSPKIKAKYGKTAYSLGDKFDHVLSNRIN